MTYTFPKTLAPLREYLRGLAADVSSFATARQAAYMAQQLLGTRIKFPPQGQDMTSTLFLIQKAVTGRVDAPSTPCRSSKGNQPQSPAKQGGKGGRVAKGNRQRPARTVVTCDYSAGLHIFCDGAAVPNPGVGGWGVVVYQDGAEIGSQSGGDPQTTNNIMEMTALLIAIEKAVQLSGNSGTLITIWSDSQYCVEGVNTWMPTWKARGWNKRKLNSPKRDDGGIKNLELWQAIDEALTTASGAQIAIRWVKGHSGVAGNERADELAEMGRLEAEENHANLHSFPHEDLDERYRQIMGAM